LKNEMTSKKVSFLSFLSCIREWKAYPDTAAVLIRHFPAGKSFPTPSCEEESEYGKLLLYSL